MRKKILFLYTLFLVATSVFSQTRIDTLLQELSVIKQESIRLKYLDTLTEAMVRSNHLLQTQYLKQTITLAKKLNQYDLAVMKSRYIIQGYIAESKLDSAILFVNSTLKDSLKFKQERSVGQLILKRAGAYYSQEYLELASKDYKRAISIFRKTGDSIYEADALFFSGQVLSDLKNFPEAVSNYILAYKLYKNLEDLDYATYVLGELALIYSSNGFNEKAIEEYKKTIDLSLENENYFAVGVANFNIAAIYEKIGDYEKQLNYTNIALSYVNKIPQSHTKNTYLMFINLSFAEYYIVKKDLVKSQEHLQKADEFRKKTDAPAYYENDFLLAKARYYQVTNNNEAALVALQKILSKKGEHTIHKGKFVEAQKRIADIYKSKGNFKKAVQHLNIYTTIKDSVNDIAKKNTYLFYQSQFEAERKDNEIFHQKTTINLLEKDKIIAVEKRKALLGVLFSFLLVALSFIFFIWQRGKQKRIQLIKQLNVNKKELSNFTKALIQKSRDKELLTQELEHLKQSFGESENLVALDELAKTKILTPDNWRDFKNMFAKVYPHFFIKINNKGLKLTNAEERLIALEKLQLKTLEIANMLGVSTETVRTSRYRLRKKLNAPNTISIIEFLESI